MQVTFLDLLAILLPHNVRLEVANIEATKRAIAGARLERSPREQLKITSGIDEPPRLCVI